MTYRHCYCLFVAAAFAFCTLPLAAQTMQGTSFSHGDWELACDNTRTCRAVGYPDGEEPGTVTVLLTRKAGPGTAVMGRVMVGSGWGDEDFKLPASFKLELRIDGRAHGSVAMTSGDRTADLTGAQVAALLGALTRDSRIEFRTQSYNWRLSDNGASAVLLKMDEVQGRVGTVGALRRKGKASEANVLPPLPAPVVQATRLHPALPGDARLFETLRGKQSAALRKALLASAGDDGCMDMEEPREGGPHPLEISRLSKTRLLVSTQCWMAAYNMGNGYWVIDAKAPYNPQLVTADGTDYDNGVIGATHKSRGLGDCWGTEEWTWNGTAFVHTASSSTGDCRGFPGGAWSLPTLVTDVVKGK